MNAITNWDDVPLFDREEAEAAFWADNRIDVRLMERSVTAGSEMADSVTITLRIDPRMLTRIKRIARSRYLNYQSMMKQWLSERMEHELREQRLDARAEGGGGMRDCGLRIADFGLKEVGGTRTEFVVGRSSCGFSIKNPTPSRVENFRQSAIRHIPESFRGRPQSAIQRAFTLIELLAVITIISIIAAMVVGLSAAAARKKHDAVVNAMKNRLMLFIGAYHSKMGFYPPDNITNVLYTGDTNAYYLATGFNPLLYELTGATMLPGSNTFAFLAYNSNVITGAMLSAAYGRGGIANSLPDETHVFFQPLPSPKDYVVVNGLEQLIVPVGLSGAANETNYWHYDSSSTNRHNPASYDLWAVYGIGNGNVITNGNWNP